MKALVLASGGVDSTTCLGLAVNKYGKENVIALTVAIFAAVILISSVANALGVISM